MRNFMELQLTAYFTYAAGAPLSLATAVARAWAVGYVWQMAEIRNKFGKLELELFAATLS